MPEHGSLLRKTETPQTNSKNQQEKPRPWIMKGLDAIEKTDPIDTKKGSGTYTPSGENLSRDIPEKEEASLDTGTIRSAQKEKQETVDPNPEIILMNNKIYQRRGFWPVYEYLQMYVDTKDNTLKSFSYNFSDRLQNYSDALKTGKAKALSYQEASKLAKEKTDKNGYIWIPETKNTTQEHTPIIESKDKGTLAREL